MFCVTLSILYLVLLFFSLNTGHRDMALPIVVRGILIEPFDYQTQKFLFSF